MKLKRLYAITALVLLLGSSFAMSVFAVSQAELTAQANQAAQAAQKQAQIAVQQQDEANQKIEALQNENAETKKQLDALTQEVKAKTPEPVAIKDVYTIFQNQYNNFVQTQGNLMIWGGILVAIVGIAVPFVFEFRISRDIKRKADKKIRETDKKINEYLQLVEGRFNEYTNTFDKKVDHSVAMSTIATFTALGSAEKELDKRIELFSKAIEASNGIETDSVVVAYLCRGNARYELRQYNEAILDYSAVIGIDSDRAEAYLNRGNVWFDKEEFDSAIMDFSKALELAPSNMLAYLNRGNAWYEKEDYIKAIYDFEKALELEPNNVSILFNVGNTWDSMEDYDKAIESYSKAIEIDQYDASIFYNRGIAWYKKGEYDNVINDFEKAIGLDVDNKTYIDAHEQAIAEKSKQSRGAVFTIR